MPSTFPRPSHALPGTGKFKTYLSQLRHRCAPANTSDGAASARAAPFALCALAVQPPGQPRELTIEATPSYIDKPAAALALRAISPLTKVGATPWGLSRLLCMGTVLASILKPAWLRQGSSCGVMLWPPHAHAGWYKYGLAAQSAVAWPGHLQRQPLRAVCWPLPHACMHECAMHARR